MIGTELLILCCCTNTACTFWAASGISACGVSQSVEGQPSAPCYSCPNNLEHTCVLATFSAALIQVMQPSIPVFFTPHFNHTQKLLFGLWLKLHLSYMQYLGVINGNVILGL